MLFRSLLAKRKRMVEKSIDDNEQQFVDERLGFEKKLELSDESSYLIKKINQLDNIYKEVLELRYFEEMSYSDIADLLECNVGTVKSRLFKAKEILKHMMLQDERGEVKIGA